MPNEYEIPVVLGCHAGRTIKARRPEEFIQLPAELPADPADGAARFEVHTYKLERLRIPLKDGFRERWVYVPTHASPDEALAAALAPPAAQGEGKP